MSWSIKCTRGWVLACWGNMKLSLMVPKLSGCCRDLLLLFLVVNLSNVCPVTELTLLHPVFYNHAVLSSFCITPGSQTPKRLWRHAAKGNASFGKNTRRELDGIKAKKMVSKVKRWNLEGCDHRGLLFLCLFSRSCDHRGQRALGYTRKSRGEQEVWWPW